jgi:hypothetical protein
LRRRSRNTLSTTPKKPKSLPPPPPPPPPGLGGGVGLGAGVDGGGGVAGGGGDDAESLSAIVIVVLDGVPKLAPLTAVKVSIAVSFDSIELSSATVS